MTELLDPSPALVEAARADRDRLHEAWRELQGQRADLLVELERIDGDLNELAGRMRRLGELIGDQLAFDMSGDGEALPETATGNDALSGAEIRKTAVAILLSTPEPSQLLHYRDWFELVMTSGYEIKGRDPYAVFLTQISRSPLVVRGDANGTYRLDQASPTRLGGHLRALREQRDALVHGKHEQDRWDLESLTAKLHELTLEARRTERHLAEAMNTIRELGAEDYFAAVEAVRVAGAPAREVRVVA